jgi:hypothetical protein
MNYELDHIGNKVIEARILLLADIVRVCIAHGYVTAAYVYTRLIGRKVLDRQPLDAYAAHFLPEAHHAIRAYRRENL